MRLPNKPTEPSTSGIHASFSAQMLKSSVSTTTSSDSSAYKTASQTEAVLEVYFGRSTPTCFPRAPSARAPQENTPVDDEKAADTCCYRSSRSSARACAKAAREKTRGGARAPGRAAVVA